MSDLSACALEKKSLNAWVGGGSSRPPPIAGDVLMSVSDSTRSGWSSASELREPAPGREAHDVRGRDAVGVEQPGRVIDEVVGRVARPARLVGDRAAGVALVVADHEAPGA